MSFDNLPSDVLRILLVIFAGVQIAKIIEVYLPVLISNLSRKPSSSHHNFSFLVPSIVAHARFLPIESKHKFKYPALFVTTELNALESGQLDLGRWFRWKGIATGRSGEVRSDNRSVLSLIPEEYLRLKFGQMDTETATASGEADLAHSVEISSDDHDRQNLAGKSAERLRGSILLKLVYELRARGFLKSGPQDGDWGDQKSGPGWRSELGQVWSLTMPSIFGFQGINPLTIYYCYRPHESVDRRPSVATSDKRSSTSKQSTSSQRGPFWLAVLEVHNTFSERHVYILESNVREDTDSSENPRRKGYQHQWTFERSFHVSPFNDRGGFYCLMMNELFRSPKVGTGEEADLDDVGDHEQETHIEKRVQLPQVDIRLLLLVNSSDADLEQEPVKAGSLASSPLRTSQSSRSGSSLDSSRSSDSNLTKSTSTSHSTPASTSASPGPKFQKKLLATLKSHPLGQSKSPTHFSPLTIFKSLSRQPLDLFLTTFRILFEAGKLHFEKKLDAFARPDMMQKVETMYDSDLKAGVGRFDGVGLPPVPNAIESRRSRSSSRRREGREEIDTPIAEANKESSGGLLWPQESWVEKVARETFLEFSTTKLNSESADPAGQHDRVSIVKVISTDDAVQDLLIQSGRQDQVSNSSPEDGNLTIFTRSPAFYTDILLYPSPTLALLFGSRVGRRWGVSDIQRFEAFLAHDSTTRGAGPPQPKDWKSKMLHRIRARHLKFSLKRLEQSESERKSQKLKTLLSKALVSGSSSSPLSALDLSESQCSRLQTRDLPYHPYEDLFVSWKLLISLLLLHLAITIEYHLFHILGARYVENTEPWLEVSRGLKLLHGEEKLTKEGSEESWDLLDGSTDEMDSGRHEKNPGSGETAVKRAKMINKKKEEQSDRPVWLGLGSVRRQM